MESEIKVKYGSGYDIGSRLYIVGIRTEWGTIAETLFSFADVKEADAKAKKLNGELK